MWVAEVTTGLVFDQRRLFPSVDEALAFDVVLLLVTGVQWYVCGVVIESVWNRGNRDRTPELAAEGSEPDPLTHVASMRTAWLKPVVGGVAAGVALSVYARSRNGFQVGPGMLAFLAILSLLAIVGAGLALWGGHRNRGKQLLIFAAATIAMLFLLAIVWPYPAPELPQPWG